MLHARICGGYCDCGRFVENFIYRKRPRFSGECFKRGRLGPKMSFHTFRFRGGLRQSGGRVAYCDACIFCRHKTDRGTGKWRVRGRDQLYVYLYPSGQWGRRADGAAVLCIWRKRLFNYRLVHRGGRGYTFQLSGSGIGQSDVCSLLRKWRQPYA